jgi:hypoxanthine phosphoribosyltransferase
VRPIPLPRECSRLVLSGEQISARVEELGEEITAWAAGEPVRMVTVLKGGVVFLSDLCRAVHGEVTIDFLAVESYAPGAQGGVRVTKDVCDDLRGGAVVLVEDVLDTGLTVGYVERFLRAHEPSRFEICTLFDKPARRIVPVEARFVGFELGDDFVVGYGLDLRGRYRNLDYLAAVREEAVFS